MSDQAQGKKKRGMLTSFSIIFILLAIVCVITVIVSGITTEVTGVSLSDFLMAPAQGFADAIDVCLFVMVLGGFLGIMNKTNALSDGIAVLASSPSSWLCSPSAAAPTACARRPLVSTLCCPPR